MSRFKKNTSKKIFENVRESTFEIRSQRDITISRLWTIIGQNFPEFNIIIVMIYFTALSCSYGVIVILTQAASLQHYA